jgi:hypothetical protein
LLTESVLLGVLGGLGGVVVALLGLYVVRAINPGNIPRLEAIGLDGGVLAFTLAVSILTGLVFGLAPALRAASVDLNGALKAGGRASQGAGGFTLSRHRLRSLLVISELAFSLMLLIGAGLLVRSFLRLQNVPPGFNPDHVLSARIEFSGPRYSDRKVAARTFQELTGRLARIPGVKAAGAVSALPFTSSVGWGGMAIEGYVPPPNEPELQVDQRAATTDYFRTMEIPLLQGRFFTEQDTPDSPPPPSSTTRWRSASGPHRAPSETNPQQLPFAVDQHCGRGRHREAVRPRSGTFAWWSTFRTHSGSSAACTW